MSRAPVEVTRLLQTLLAASFSRLAFEPRCFARSSPTRQETDRYGLGIGQITALMGRQRSACGAAWGHLGFSVGYTTIALSSEDGERQVVICANGVDLDTEAFWDAAGQLAWRLYCM